DLRTLHDWVITPRLLRVPGVGDVANFGGDAKQFAGLVQPTQLQRFGGSLSALVDAVRNDNGTSRGSLIRRRSMSVSILRRCRTNAKSATSLSSPSAELPSTCVISPKSESNPKFRRGFLGAMAAKTSATVQPLPGATTPLRGS